MRILAYDSRLPVIQGWKDKVTEEGLYWCRAADDEDIPECVSGPFWCQLVEQTGSYVFMPWILKNNSIPANDGKWMWSKA